MQRYILLMKIQKRRRNERTASMPCTPTEDPTLFLTLLLLAERFPANSVLY